MSNDSLDKNRSNLEDTQTLVQGKDGDHAPEPTSEKVKLLSDTHGAHEKQNPTHFASMT